MRVEMLAIYIDIVFLNVSPVVRQEAYEGKLEPPEWIARSFRSLINVLFNFPLVCDELSMNKAKYSRLLNKNIDCAMTSTTCPILSVCLMFVCIGMGIPPVGFSFAFLCLPDFFVKDMVRVSKLPTTRERCNWMKRSLNGYKDFKRIPVMYACQTCARFELVSGKARRSGKAQAFKICSYCEQVRICSSFRVEVF